MKKVKMLEPYIKNPFNYHGGKYRLLPQILPLFPENIETFVDVFGGGGDVCFNVTANKIIYNDKCKALVEVMKDIKNSDDFIERVERIISKYKLSKTNRENYLQLRTDYNSKNKADDRNAMFYCLIAHSFSNQIGFNSKEEFNIPFGKNKSYFTSQMKDNLKNYIQKAHQLNIQYLSTDFSAIDYSKYNSKDFLYFDPPYLITIGAYDKDFFANGTTKKKYNYFQF